MYFEGKITVDPSEMTVIEKIKPVKTLQRLFYYLTIGGVKEKLERESFSTLSILKRFNKIFSKHGINNIIRLSHDGVDFYLDERGKKDDFEVALKSYKQLIEDSMTVQYKNLELVLEYEQDDFKYLIEVNIVKDHLVGEYPIEIKVTGLLKEFSYNREKINESLSEIFQTQDIFDEFKSVKENKFKIFLEQITQSVQQIIQVDDIKLDTMTKVILPTNKPLAMAGLRHQGGKIYRRYYKFDNYLLYAYLWSDLAKKYSIEHKDTSFEKENSQFMCHPKRLNKMSNFDYFSNIS